MHTSALMTDLYELTMLAGYLREGEVGVSRRLLVLRDELIASAEA